MTAHLWRLEEIAARTDAAFDDAERRFRDRVGAVRAASSGEVGRTRRSGMNMADGVVPRLLVPAGLEAARRRGRRR